MKSLQQSSLVIYKIENFPIIQSHFQTPCYLLKGVPNLCAFRDLQVDFFLTAFPIIAQAWRQSQRLSGQNG